MQTGISDYPRTSWRQRYILLAAIWSVLVVGSLVWDIYTEKQSTLRTATAAALANINKDISFRKWAASHGGVYVPPTEHTPPNPYLKVPNRDVVTTTGMALTLMNPAYMLREMQNDFPDDYGAKSHITSLKLLNPKNAPDAWEEKALHSFDQGAKELLEIQQIDGQPYLRLMRPFIVDSECLKCHAQQGYKIGDIRGGISTAIFLEPYLAQEKELSASMALSHGTIWLLGLAGLMFSYRRDRHIADERKQTEEKLRKSEEQFRAYFERSMVGMAITSLEKGWLEANDALCESLGYSREELMRMTWAELTHPEDLAPDVAQFNRMLSGEINGYAMDKRFIHKDGRIVYTRLAVSCVRRSDGSVDYIVALVEDITERKRAEIELQEKEERLALATTHNGVGVWDWNLLTQEMIWDDSMYAIYRIRREDFIGTEEAWRKALHPDDLHRGDNEVNDAIAGIKPFDTTFRVVWPSGEIRHIKAVAKVFRDARGTPMRMLGINMDITERRQAEEEVRRLNAELEQRVAERTAQLEAANKDMEGFGYSVSHDLRSPLRAIDGFSRILLEDYAGKLDDEGRRLLHVVGDNAQKMGELIDDILAFSRTTRQEVTRSEINMVELVREVMEELAPDTGGRELKLEIGMLPPAYADRTMLHQVLLNLLGNAIKFTRHKAPALIEVGVRNPSINSGQALPKEIIYYVKDNGAGFNMQYADKLFGVFHRLHGQDEFEGTGIGLAIVKRIITKHGGRVWAESKLNEGATVYFALPKR